MHTAVEYQMILGFTQVTVAQLYTQTVTKGEEENWPSELTGQILCPFAVSDGRQANRQTKAEKGMQRVRERNGQAVRIGWRALSCTLIVYLHVLVCLLLACHRDKYLIFDSLSVSSEQAKAMSQQSSGDGSLLSLCLMFLSAVAALPFLLILAGFALFLVLVCVCVFCFGPHSCRENLYSHKENTTADAAERATGANTISLL